MGLNPVKYNFPQFAQHPKNERQAGLECSAVQSLYISLTGWPQIPQGYFMCWDQKKYPGVNNMLSLSALVCGPLITG